MFGLIFSRMGAYVAIGLICAAGALYVTHSIYQAGVRAERQRTLENSIDALRAKGKVDEKIRRSTDADLCATLGGKWVLTDNQGSCE